MKKNLFLFIVSFFIAVLAQSQTIRYVVQGGAGTKNGSSWANASGDMQAMINSSVANDQVWVAKGTYYPDEGTGQINNDRAACFILKNNLAIYGGFNGDETVLGERKFNVYETILSGDIDQNDGTDFLNSDGNSFHVVCNNGNGINNTAILDGFTVTAGNAINGGGGMYNWETSPAIANCNFLKNQGRQGGAIFFATNGIQPVQGYPVLTNCSFSENSALDGGGIYNAGNSYPSLTNCNFTENEAARDGGGFWNMGAYSDIETNRFFINCKFSKNTAGNDGGGFYIHSGYLSLINCIFWANSAGSSGGALKNVYIEDGEFLDNVTVD
jgi:predicted outer membrane repeat protein